jgi:hypothetical protein
MHYSHIQTNHTHTTPHQAVSLQMSILELKESAKRLAKKHGGVNAPLHNHRVMLTNLSLLTPKALPPLASKSGASMDGSGVLNQYNLAPNALPGLAASKSGASIGSDGSGLLSQYNLAPNTPGLPASKSGASTGSDGSGLLSQYNLVPNTPGLPASKSGASSDGLNEILSECT